MPWSHTHTKIKQCICQMNTAPYHLTPFPYIIKKIKNVLTHSTVTRNVTGFSTWTSLLFFDCAICMELFLSSNRCSYSCQQNQDALNNMWEVISYNILCMLKTYSKSRPKDSILVTYSESLMNQGIGTETGGS